MNSLQRVSALSIDSIGAQLPKSRDDTEFMYQWTQSEEEMEGNGNEDMMMSECSEGMKTLQSWNGLRERLGLWKWNRNRNSGEMMRSESVEIQSGSSAGCHDQRC